MALKIKNQMSCKCTKLKLGGEKKTPQRNLGFNMQLTAKTNSSETECCHGQSQRRLFRMTENPELLQEHHQLNID